MFDPYYKWLGIPARDQPANYYRLLNIENFEDDPDVIEGAADRVMGFVRQYQSGEHAAIAAKILNEISIARLCLLKADAKSRYDAKLRKQLEPQPLADAPPKLKPRVPSANAVYENRARTKTKRGSKASENSATQLWITAGAVVLLALAAVGLKLRLTPKNVSQPPAEEVVTQTPEAVVPETVAPNPASSPTETPQPVVPNTEEPPVVAAVPKETTPVTVAPTEEPASPATVETPPVVSDAWKPGFLCQIFSRPDFVSFAKSRVDEAINFQFGLDAPESGLPEDEFSIRWLAAIQFPVAGKYGFQVAHDDGVRVWIDDRKVLEQWLTGTSSEKFEVELSAGWHQFRLDYFDQKDLSSIAVRWQPPGQEFQPLRGDLIRHNPEWSGHKDWDRLETPNRTPSQKAAPLTEADFRLAQQRVSQEIGMPAEFTNSIKMTLRLIPPGDFLMGSPSTDSLARPNERPQVPVSITRPYFIGQYEVTQREWARVMGTTPWKGVKNVVPHDKHPAVVIDWRQMREFCNKLTKLDQRAESIDSNWHYELPTEAQWEYAARAGTTDRFGERDSVEALMETDWIGENCVDEKLQHGHVVGTKKPNMFGCFDFLGNVSEACLDRPAFELVAGKDPLQRCVSEFHSVRGGSWFQPARLSRITNRLQLQDGLKSPTLGFRVCLVNGPRETEPTASPFKAGHSVTIRGVIDGTDEFRIYRDRVELIHHTWAMPENVTVNEVVWVDREKPFVFKGAPWPIRSTSGIDVMQTAGRDAITHKRHAEYVEVVARDSAAGGSWCEFTVSWDPPSK